MNDRSTAETVHFATQLRWLKAYAVVSALAFGWVFLTGAKLPDRFKTIDVERINIVDAQGGARLVISNADLFPAPVIHGKPVQRAVSPTGFVFFNAQGNEVGGLALSEADGGRLSALAFDYANSDATALLTRISPDRKDASAGLVIFSRPPESLEGPAAAKVVEQRVAVQNRNEVAEVVLSDPQGAPRLRLQVDARGEPSIQMLDARGQVTQQWPK